MQGSACFLDTVDARVFSDNFLCSDINAEDIQVQAVHAGAATAEAHVDPGTILDGTSLNTVNTLQATVTIQRAIHTLCNHSVAAAAAAAAPAHLLEPYHPLAPASAAPPPAPRQAKTAACRGWGTARRTCTAPGQHTASKSRLRSSNRQHAAIYQQVSERLLHLS